MIWDKTKISNHQKSIRLLDGIMENTFLFINKNKKVTEYLVQEYVLEQFKINNLKTDKERLIVAFGRNTSNVHYFPEKKSKTIKLGDLIMIDIWGRLKEKSSPFADITWMAYYGKNVPDKQKKIFDLVLEARNGAIKYIENCLKNKIIPTGKKIDEVARKIIINNGYGKNFLHTTGHSLGMVSPHGRDGKIASTYDKPILKNVGYTIEPGVYLSSFGVRSEIDFYINDNLKIVITGKVQKKIKIIK